jgi:hypothetical protein
MLSLPACATASRVARLPDLHALLASFSPQ